jgi:hypothetical protein
MYVIIPNVRPDIPELWEVRLKAWHIPAQWLRLGFSGAPTVRGALKGQDKGWGIRLLLFCGKLPATKVVLSGK